MASQSERIVVVVDDPDRAVVDYYESKNDPNTMHLREGTAYEVGGEEDAGREFTMTISDEMLYQLFK